MNPRLARLDLDKIDEPIDTTMPPDEQLEASMSQAANRILLLTQGFKSPGVAICEHINPSSFRYVTQHWLPNYVWCGEHEDCNPAKDATLEADRCCLCAEHMAAIAYFDLAVATAVGDGTVPWTIYAYPVCEAHRIAGIPRDDAA